MEQIKLIHKNTDIASLKMRKYPWDVCINERPFQVACIEGYIHTIGGRYGNNDLWAYPRDEEPTYENLIEFDGEPCNWGLRYEPKNYIRTKWDETEALHSGGVTITRNGEDFYSLAGGMSYGIDKARVLIQEIKEHPLDLGDIDFDKKMVGRKVWWNGQPAVIQRYIEGQACVILVREDGGLFEKPAEFVTDYFRYDEKELKDDIFSKRIWWFRG